MPHGPGISMKELAPDQKYKFFWRESGESRSKTYLCSKVEAEKILEEALIRNGRTQRKEYLFSELAEQYLRLSEHKRAFSTTERVVRLLVREFGSKPCSSFTSLDLENFQARLRSSGNKPATIRKKATFLKAIIGAGVKWKMVPPQVLYDLRAAETVKVNNARVRWLTEAEAEKLLERCKVSSNKELYPQVLIALNTGMRKSEIVNLTWGRIDLETEFIHVTNTKSGRDRFLPINGTLLALFRGWKVRRIDGKLFDGFGEWAWKYAVRDAKLTDFRFHDLRHCFASWLAQSGVELYTIQALLGHSRSDMTQRYSHLSSRETSNAVRMLDRRVGNG